MKKWIILIVLLLTGCGSQTKLINNCTKEESASTLTSITTYTIEFEKDIIQAIDITYDYQDMNEATISSIKLSTETQNQFFEGINLTILKDLPTQYKIVYHFTKDCSEDLKDKFHILEKRSKLINYLKEEGYECK